MMKATKTNGSQDPRTRWSADKQHLPLDAYVAYIVDGHERGDCGHLHKTVAAARRCYDARDMELHPVARILDGERIQLWPDLAA